MKDGFVIFHNNNPLYLYWKFCDHYCCCITLVSTEGTGQQNPNALQMLISFINRNLCF